MMMSLVNRNFDTNAMYYFRTAELTLESDKPVAWTLDGENGGSHE